MSGEENKALIKRWFGNVWQEEDVSALADEVWAEDIVINYPYRKMEGLAEFKRYLADTMAALQDGEITVNYMVAEGDSVGVHWTVSAIHAGEFAGIAGTGKRVTISATAIMRFVGGKIAEVHENHDLLGLMKQVGAI